MRCTAGCHDGWVYVDGQYVADHLVAQGTLGAAAPHPPPAGHAQALENTVRPCDQCNPDAYRLWATGHYALGHVCGECRPHRRK